MLVLSRKKDECIVINNDITIVVVEIRGDKVRLGVEAPKEVPVHRKEVYEAIARDDGGATQAEMADPSSGADRRDMPPPVTESAPGVQHAGDVPSACSSPSAGSGPAGVAKS